ncbi:hypothetical protein CKA32_007111 [Geitlerinema sp. FC II]|nr:hypothetical protein CKA32_007111 [Geitlerinema sp. FC II]
MCDISVRVSRVPEELFIADFNNAFKTTVKLVLVNVLSELTITLSLIHI